MGRSCTLRYRAKFAACGMAPSHQRLKILALLDELGGHPSVQEVYTKLRERLPHISKTTVYNALQALQSAGAIQGVMIDGKQVRYDLKTVPHGHFRCEQCGRIIDFQVDSSSFITPELANCIVRDKHVYCHGVCERCHEDIDKEV